MKKFDDFKSAFNWIEKIVSDTNKQAIEEVARKVYEDSKKFTYIDTEDMLNSGDSSDFKGGYVLIKAPQVRWLYYTSGLTPHKNKSAVPQWFERTKTENMDSYVKLYDNIIVKNKG